MLWPLSCGSSYYASTWLRATLLLPGAGWTQPNSVPSPSVALSALPLLWQLANQWVREEPDTEGQSLSSNIAFVFKSGILCVFFPWELCVHWDQTKRHRSDAIFFHLPFIQSTEHILFLIPCLLLLTTPSFYCWGARNCVIMTSK